MQNGGGPACLRLRVVMNSDEFSSINSNFVFSENLYKKLRNWIIKYYDTNVIYDDLMVPAFIRKCRNSFSELSDLLNVSNLYNI